MKIIKKSQRGFTLIEVLVALFITGVLTTATMQFYVSQHNNMLVQHNVSDMQQNLRACGQELTTTLRNAGSNLPNNLLSIDATDGNPDSLTIRFSYVNGSVDVGDNTQIIQTAPIHINNAIDMSAFKSGMTVYLWHEGIKTGEWFTITQVTLNNGTGWIEVYHQGQELLFEPLPGDKLIVLEESSYFINRADSTNPLFMKMTNGGVPQVYAENIDDFQLQFTLSDNSVVDTISVNDTVYVINVSLTAHTEDVDIALTDRNKDGRRRRSLSTDILVRNNRF